MRWVAHAADRPHKCAVLPFIGNSNAKQGFIDTGTILNGWDPHVYVSVEAVQEMGRMIGWQPVHMGNTSALHDKAAKLQVRVEALEAENAALQAKVDAIDVFESAGFTARRKPGRPPKVVA